MSTNYRHIKASAEEVFGVLADGWLFPGWVVGASRMRKVEPAWPSPGSKLHHSFGVWPLVIDDTTSSVEWDPPRHAKFQARGWPIGESTVTIDVKTCSDGCVVRMYEDATNGPGRFIPKPLRDLGLLVRNKEALRRLAWVAENR